MSDEEKTRILRGPATPAGGRPSEPRDEGATRILSPQSLAEELGRLTGKIVFECPNGHRITVDESLAGKRGKCSKCGVGVAIPGPGDGGPPEFPGVGFGAAVSDAKTSKEGREAAAPPPLEIPSLGEQAAPEAEPESWNFIGGPAEAALPEAPPAVAWPVVEGAAAFGDEGGNPTAQLVARLWLERNHGGVIELHLEGGSVILPEWYDPLWSRGTHGLFGSRAGDSITITAVAWDTVQKVVVRQLTEMPDDMFT